MVEQADRYTVIEKHPGDILEVASACSVLGLHWFAQSSPGREKARVYIFFDYAGMRNYLRGEYDPEDDPLQEG